MAGKVKKKRELNESQLGYFLVAPSIIIILIIALYPVAKSFWYSMFDLRLNNPTKNAIYLSYKFDMERYFNDVDVAKGSLRKAADAAQGNEKEKLSKDYEKFNIINSKILSNKKVAENEKAVRVYTDKYQPVSDTKLRYQNIDKETATLTRDGFESIRQDMITLNTNNKDVKSYIDKASGLFEELRDSAITPNFVGLNNYKYFAKDQSFWSALGFTFIFTMISVTIELVLGILVAVIMNKSFRGRGIVRASVLVPWAIPTVVAAMMWKFLYDGQTGFMANLFANLHLIKNSGVLLTTHGGSTFAMVFADVWKTAPYMALLILAGLQGIDGSLYEAANVDGATVMQSFFRITLPLLKPTILVALLFRTLDAFRIFDLVFVLTGGANGTETITTLAYKNMFAQLQFGKGSALSVVVFICVALISIAYIKFLGAEVLSGNEGN